MHQQESSPFPRAKHALRGQRSLPASRMTHVQVSTHLQECHCYRNLERLFGARRGLRFGWLGRRRSEDSRCLAADGDTITMSAGIFSWPVRFNNSKAITLQGQTTITEAGTANPVINDATIIQDDTPRTGAGIGSYGRPTQRSE